MEKAKGVHLILPRCGKQNDSEAYGLIVCTRSEKQRKRNPRVIFILPGRYEDLYPSGPPRRLRRRRWHLSVPQQTRRRICFRRRGGSFLKKRSIEMRSSPLMPAPVRSIAANLHKRGLTRTGFVSREHLITESPSGVMYLLWRGNSPRTGRWLRRLEIISQHF